MTPLTHPGGQFYLTDRPEGEDGRTCVSNYFGGTAAGGPFFSGSFSQPRWVGGCLLYTLGLVEFSPVQGASHHATQEGHKDALPLSQMTFDGVEAGETEGILAQMKASAIQFEAKSSFVAMGGHGDMFESPV